MTRIEQSVVIQVPVKTEIHDFVRNRGWTGIATKGISHRTINNLRKHLLLQS